MSILYFGFCLFVIYNFGEIIEGACDVVYRWFHKP